MDALDDVKSYMHFWGWSQQGGPGAIKLDDAGNIIGRHGDAVWIADVDAACATLGRLHDRILADNQQEAREK